VPCKCVLFPEAAERFTSQQVLHNLGFKIVNLYSSHMPAWKAEEAMPRLQASQSILLAKSASRKTLQPHRTSGASAPRRINVVQYCSVRMCETTVHTILQPQIGRLWLTPGLGNYCNTIPEVKRQIAECTCTHLFLAYAPKQKLLEFGVRVRANMPQLNTFLSNP
jgi:hypothetical protein